MKKLVNIMTTIILFVLQLTLLYTMSALLWVVNVNIFDLENKYKIWFYVLFYLLFMIFLFVLYHKTLISDFKDFKKNYKKYLKFGIKCWLLSVLLMIISNILIQTVYPGVSENEQIVSNYTKNYPIYMLFCNIIYAPFSEELIYRKSIRNIFTNNILYIVFSGLIFGYIHTIASSNEMEILYVIPYGVVGAMFAYIHAKTKNIFTSITLHALHNGIVTALYLLPMIIK